MIHRTRVKFCGLTRAADVARAVALGVDAVGFVFVSASPRAVSVGEAQALVAGLPSMITPVGLFMDADAEEIESALKAIPMLLPQFHGRESAADCERWQRPYLKALGMAGGNAMPESEALSEYEHCAGFLLDSHAPGALGGTGQRFDWSRLDADNSLHGRALILAGGLDNHNVHEAIEHIRPYAVDVSSGIEQSRGVKDAEAMGHFMAAVRAADAARAARDEKR